MMFRPSHQKRMIFFILFDISLSLLSLLFAYHLRFNFEVPTQFWDSFVAVFMVLTLLKIALLYCFRGYGIIWRFFSFSDAKNIFKAHIVAYGVFIVVFLLFREALSPFARSIIMIDFFLSLIFLGALRSLKRLLVESTRRDNIKSSVIFGADSKTSTIIQSALKREIEYYPVAIIALPEDEFASLKYLNNIRVYDMSQMEEAVQRHGVQSAIFTRKLPQEAFRTIISKLNHLNIYEIKQVKLLGSNHEKLEDISIEDLLARHPKDLDIEVIGSFIKDKSVLITGAGGSIGSEIARQCDSFGASKLILIDHSEYNLYHISEALPKAAAHLFNITNTPLLEAIFRQERPDIVIHAAAYKHVPICEANPETAVYNNVYGTKNVIDTSIAHGVQKVVIISTDKAVRPTNVMGATKRVTELYANNVDAKCTEIVAVRFGNVLGSSGSVIPKFKEQIESGGPVTVTHPEITRYFMLIPEACQLVLQAAAIAKGGELFVLDMGEPVKIVDLARQMIRLYGKEDEVEVVFTRLRPGEKLYEELLLDESEKQTEYRSIFIAKPTPYAIERLNEDIETLLQSTDKITALQKIVPEFTRGT